MPQPPEVEGAHGQLLAEYQAAHGRLQAAVASARGSDAQQLDQSLGALRGIFEQLDADTRGFVSATIPSIYQVGAASTGITTSWDQASLEAVQALANQNYNDLLSTNQLVEGTTRRALRDLARAGALDVVAGGKPVARAGRDLANLIQDAHGKVMTVTYSNGAVHSLADWADTALRTQTALAYNAGAIAQYREYGIDWVELSDGADCGLTSHDDPELANGLVVPLDVAEEYPLAHPRCGRSILPRPDITSAEEADAANGHRDPGELQRQADLERQRAAQGTLSGQRFGVDTEEARVAGRVRRSRQPRASAKTRTAGGGRVPRTPRGQGPPAAVASAAVPATPPAWKAAVAQRAAPQRAAQAAARGMSITEFETAAVAHLTALSARADVYTRITPKNLEAVLRDGRFKTQFETGHSGGLMDPPLRRSTEKAVWGIPAKAPPSARPFYGYAAEEPFKDQILDLYDDGAGISVRFKPPVKRRATITVGDTLDKSNTGGTPGLAPAPYDAPTLEAVYRKVDPLEMKAHSDDLIGTPGNYRPLPYSEVQIFGNVTVDDIEEVLIKKTPNDPGTIPDRNSLIAALKNAGVPYRLVP